MPVHFRHFILAILASVLASGCASWSPTPLSRPLGKTISKANLEEMVRAPVIATADPARSQPQGTGTRQPSTPASTPIPPTRSSDVAANERDNPQPQRAEYQSPDWPDSIYWDEVYRKINEADTRQVNRAGVVKHPLQPLPGAKNLQENSLPAVHHQLLAELKSPTIIASEPIRDQHSSLTPRVERSRDIQSVTHHDSLVSPAVFERPERDQITHSLQVAKQSSANDLRREPASSSATSATTTSLPWMAQLSCQLLEVCSKQSECKSKTDESLQDNGSSDFCRKLSELRNLICRELSDDALPEQRRQALQLGERMISMLEQTDTGALSSTNTMERQLQEIQAILRQGTEVPVALRGQQAYSALTQLREAELELVPTATLKIRNPTFCTEVLGFGQYRETERAVFERDQSVLIYCELENYVSRKELVNNHTKFTTRLRTSLVICDRENQIVQQIEFPTVEDHARGYRRDFYLFVPLTVGLHSPGTYRLYLSVTDLEGNKTTTLDPPLSFEVR